MYQHLLVPLDASPLAAVLTERAVAYARATAARISFLHVRGDLGSHGDGALLHALSPALFAEAASGNAAVLVARAEAAARAAGVPADTLVVTSERPAEAIVQAAQDRGADLIALASHGRRKGFEGLKGALIGSVTRQVLEQAGLPVLVMAVETHLPQRSDEQRALALLRDEHRSLAAVLHALLAEVQRPPQAQHQALLGAMLFYIEQFPERLHHPKEETQLFARLRQRTSAFDGLLAELQAQHTQGASAFAALQRSLRSGERVDFAAQVQTFAQQQWRHMDHEEKVVLPAASQHLLPEDWRAIAEAFEANADPRLGTGESFDRLASRLLELAHRT
jgi:nucleotide-binding universal stress UspA family protein/hemerythrin-like domain-containing protein